MLTDMVPDEVLNELKSRLMMEGVLNRESEILRLRIRLHDMAVDAAENVAELRSVIAKVDEMMNAEDKAVLIHGRDYTTIQDLIDSCHRFNAMMEDVMKEMATTIEERANR